MRPSWKCLLIGVVMVAALASVAPQADAQYWGYYRPAVWGYAPYYASYGACCGTGYSDWYTGWRPGPVRRVLFGPYRWYWGGYGGYWGGCYGGCYSSCYGCYSGCSDCYGSTTVDCGCNGSSAAPSAAPQSPTPAKKAEPPVPAEPGSAPAPAPKAGMSASESGILTVWVPYDAKVSINGVATKSTGSRRQYVSFDLKSGLSYKYEVKATVVRNGQTLEDNRTVVLTAGETTAVAFGFNVQSQQQVASTR